MWNHRVIVATLMRRQRRRVANGGSYEHTFVETESFESELQSQKQAPFF